MEKLADEAETAASKQDMGKLYKITKLLSNRFQASYTPVKDQNGNIVTKDEDNLKCWKEHFQKVLNRDGPVMEVNIRPPLDNLDIDLEPPRYLEVTKPSKILKTEKPLG